MSFAADYPFEPGKDPLRDLLSREELKELLTPIGAEPGRGGDEPAHAVLLVSERPDDAEQLASHLKARGTQLIPAANRFAALDQFRRRAFRGVIATLDSVGNDASLFLTRLREVNAKIQVGFIGDPGSAESPLGRRMAMAGPLVERPLDPARLEQLLAFVPPGRSATPEPVAPVASVADRAAELSQAATESGAAARTPLAEAAPQGSSPAAAPGLAPARTGPDLGLAMRALLEARVANEGLGPAMRRWFEADAGLDGLASLVREGGGRDHTLHTRARSEDAGLRLLRDMANLPPRSSGRNPDSVGAFCVFSDPDHAGRSFAVSGGREGVPFPEAVRSALEGLLPLVRKLGPLGVVASTAPGVASSGQFRRSLLRLLDARMRSSERHDARLVLVVAEGIATAADPARLDPILRTVLRGSDWIEQDGRRVYAILERPERGWRAALAARLRGHAESRSLRVVGLIWKPLEENSEQFLARAEARIAHNPGAPLLELEES